MTPIVDSASRQVVTSLAQAVPLSKTLNITSYQFLYRTTGAVGDPQATVVTLLIPPSARKNQLVNYAIAYDTAEWDCIASSSNGSTPPCRLWIGWRAKQSQPYA